MSAGSPSGPKRIRSRLESELRHRMPRSAYQIAVSGYNQARARAARGPGCGRILPDFVIIGAAKAGTTSLYGWLTQHPCVASATQKEVHYFDYNYFRGEDWYRSHFPRHRDRDAFAAVHGRPFLTGEASPPYLSHAWAPQRLAADLPQVKLLVTLRDPVDRAYSQFQMSRREREEPLASFGDAVAAEGRRLAPELARTRTDRRYQSWPIGCWSYLMRSRYAEQLEVFYRLFGRDQLHVMTLEELSAEPQGTLDRVHEFLGLPAHRYAGLEPLHTASYDAISPELRASLNDYFRPHNERLYALLGRDLGWSSRAASSAAPSASEAR